MKKINTIHIHTEYMNIWSLTEPFEGNVFNNTRVIIEKQNPYKGPQKENTLIFQRTDNNIRKIVEMCSEADLVVLHKLDLIKSRIALALPQNTKIAWRFFGYELYGRRKDLYSSDKSKMASRADVFKSMATNIKRIYYLIKYRDTPDSIFYKAVMKINYMFVLSRDEYTLLTKYWRILPEFIRIKTTNWNQKSNLDLLDFNMKKHNELPIVVVGNNRNIWNNHLDIIELIDQDPNKSKYNFSLLFNYGTNGSYARTVRKAVEDKFYFTLLEGFIPAEKFKHFYNKISALVINSYRQMAAGNIFLALYNGAKVYLNQKNVFFSWLRKEGFQIYTIEDFENDLKNNNLTPDYSSAQKNFRQLTKFSNRYTKEDFQKVLYDKLIEDINYKGLV